MATAAGVAVAWGLTSEEARHRLSEVGPNEPALRKHSTLLAQTLALFLNPLVIILLISSAISAALGELVNASIIAVIVLLSLALNFYQTYRSERAVEELRSKSPGASSFRATSSDWRPAVRSRQTRD
jgi:Mg2+-importing ATPase